MILRITLILTGFAWIAGCGLSGSLPQFDITPDKRSDRVELREEKGRRVIEIFSESGIGAAEVTLHSGNFRDGLKIRLHLRGLESFQLITAQQTLKLSVSSSQAGQVSQELQSGSGVTLHRERLDEGSIFWVGVQQSSGAAGAAAGYFELTIPPIYFPENPRSFSFRWIDFYRE
ncbi:MAG: hypothetical protein KDH97_18580 [Calditrichaeota bacterium]|nr:hypothetical protein [Calditrichota bacterium]MCB0298314.1 hypothetical protein [Calditrichota bacterium]MCB0306118.1 hypothetical protein [Calditrichota bacterium]MCB0314293.1 hypothetical protein [Calditrichota bacterium]MCB9089359.1 hypothetical protein [Calditrichia bacterium]